MRESSNRVFQGRIERKMKRKDRVELSLKVAYVDRTQTLFVLKDGSAQIQHPTCLQLQALVKATVVVGDDSDEVRTWIVQSLELLECPPDPMAIKAVLEVPELWKTLRPYEATKGSFNEMEESKLEEDFMNPNHAMMRRILLRLEGRVPTQPRMRPPHVSFKLLEALDEMERQIDLVDIHDSSQDIPSESLDLASVGWNLPETDDGRILVSARHKLTRQQYLESKKHPQIAWFLQRVKSFPEKSIRHVLDVGGGRGDLAIAIAIELGPDTRVTIVDLNESSLEAGRRFAEQCGVANQMNWIFSDFQTFAESDVSTFTNTKSGIVDMVVALHACGNLSDLALEYAVRQNASFLICPCCYSKMSHPTAASRLAEISERPDLSRRGMHVVNSKRYWDLMAQDSHHVLIEEYSRAWSSRNMVLVGWPKGLLLPVGCRW